MSIVKESFVAAGALLYTKLSGRLNMSYLEIAAFGLGWLIGSFIYVAAKNYVKFIQSENGKGKI